MRERAVGHWSAWLPIVVPAIAAAIAVISVTLMSGGTFASTIAVAVPVFFVTLVISWMTYRRRSDG